MFGWFKQEPAPVAPTVTPAAIEQEDRGAKLREKMEQAKSELQKINVVVSDNRTAMKSLQEELDTSLLRSAELAQAIEVGQQQMKSAPNPGSFEVLIQRARRELREELDKQAPLEGQIATIRQFLESVEEQQTELVERVRKYDTRLTALELRNIGTKVNQSIGEVETDFNDYRRDVYTNEAHRELISE